MTEAEQAATILLGTIRMVIGTAQKTNDNGIQVTVVLPKKVWERLEKLAKVDDQPKSEGG